MARSHTHWPEGKGPVCRFETKRECDAFVREHNAAFKIEQAALKEAKKQAERLRQQAAADDFIAKEWARMTEAASGGRVSDVSGDRDRASPGQARVGARAVSGLRRVRRTEANQSMK